MDDEYRKFLESAWQSTTTCRRSTASSSSSSVILKTSQVAAPAVTEVIEIEAGDDDEDEEDDLDEEEFLEDASEAVVANAHAPTVVSATLPGRAGKDKGATTAVCSGSVARPKPGIFKAASIARSSAASPVPAATAAAAAAAAPIKTQMATAGPALASPQNRIVVLEQTRHQQHPKVTTARSPSAVAKRGQLLPAKSPGVSLAGAGNIVPGKVERLEDLLGEWIDSMNNIVEVAQRTIVSDRLSVKLTRPNGNPVQLEVKQTDNGSFTCSFFNMDTTKSSKTRLCWTDRRDPKKVSVWKRPQQAEVSADAASPSKKQALDSSAQATANPVLGKPAAKASDTTFVQQTPATKSLGARAKVRAGPPPTHVSDAATTSTTGEASIELATFLGEWNDTLGNNVLVDAVGPTGSVIARLAKPGQQPKRLSISERPDGGFSCGHYNLDVVNSTASNIIWLDKFNVKQSSVWTRPSVNSGSLKRPWSAVMAPVAQHATLGAPAVPKLVIAPGMTPFKPAGLPVPQAARDLEGRSYDLHSVVVNFVDVGRAYVMGVLMKNPEYEGDDVDWEGVRRCVRYLRTEREMDVFGIVPESFQAHDSGSGRRTKLPEDILLMCEQVEEAEREPYAGEQGSSRETTVQRAYEKNCLIVDSSVNDFRVPLAVEQKTRAWLQRCVELLQLRYYFDSKLATFDVFDGNVETGKLARMNSFS